MSLGYSYHPLQYSIFNAERKISIFYTMQRILCAHQHTLACIKSLSTEVVKLAQEMSTMLPKNQLIKVRIEKHGNCGFTSLRDEVQKKKKERIAVAPLH